MSSEDKHHHKKKEDGDKAATGSARGYSETVTTDLLSMYEMFARQQKLDLGETGGDFDDLYDEGEAKKDPEHKQYLHKITEDVAATAAVGTGVYAFSEHHEKKKDAEEASGEKKHRHLLG